MITYGYDRLARPETALYRDGKRWTQNYDTSGRLIEIADPLGRWTIAYDIAGQVAAVNGPSHPNTQPMSNVYDAIGQRSELADWFGRVTAVYDGVGAQVVLVDPTAKRTSATYDAAGQVVRQVNRDGSVTTVTYDSAGRQTGLQHCDAAGNQLDLALLAYDAAGNPLLKVTADGPHTMTYDAGNQLLSEYHPLAGVKTWTFDPAGNRLSQDFTQEGGRSLTNWLYDLADQLVTETTGAAVTTYTFDGAGNQYLEAALGGVTSNTWDSENRLIAVVLPNGIRNTMSYRTDGRRHRLTDTEGDKQMVWDSQGTSGYGDLLEERI